MMSSKWFKVACAICLWGCEYTTESTGCPPVASVDVAAAPGALQSDGSLAVYGSIRIAPVVPETAAAGTVPEGTVDALYVAYVEVQLASDAFNFRSWTVSLTPDRLAAFTTTMSDGSGEAQLPVRAYIDGTCVMEMPQSKLPIIKIPKPE
jgi:hypothetical protein